MKDKRDKRVQKNKRVKKNRASKRKKIFLPAILTVVILLLFVVGAIFWNGMFKKTEINGVVFRGKVTETVVFPEQKSAYINKGKKIAYNVKVTYSDSNGNMTTVEMKEPKLEFVLSGLAKKVITVKGDNVILINDNAKDGDNVSFTVRYKDDEMNYTYVIKEDFKIDEGGYVTNQDSTEVLVNKERKLKKSYSPKNLTTPDVTFAQPNKEVRKMQKVAADPLEKMFNDAKKNNINLYAVSGYRSYSLQEQIFASNVSRYGSEKAANKVSAKPGQSEHQTGLAMDISSQSMGFGLEEAFADTAEGKWLAANCHKYGFIIRYKKGTEKITGYVYEPWHVRYVGKDIAKEVYEKDITLEEYFDYK